MPVSVQVTQSEGMGFETELHRSEGQAAQTAGSLDEHELLGLGDAQEGFLAAVAVEVVQEHVARRSGKRGAVGSLEASAAFVAQDEERIVANEGPCDFETNGVDPTVAVPVPESDPIRTADLLCLRSCEQVRSGPFRLGRESRGREGERREGENGLGLHARVDALHPDLGSVVPSF